jgi:predicted DNA binding CopG/RHH family protein
MPKTPRPITIPAFRNTEEEATWWESRAGKRAATELMKRAAASGNLKRRAVPLKTVSIRLPVADLEAAQAIAAAKGLPYQTYIKMLLHEALRKERRSA